MAYTQPRRAALLSLMEKAQIPGLSLAYMQNGKVVELYALGVGSADTQEPVDTATIFSACSLSKCVFAYAVMSLVEQGKLDLDKPLYHYFDYPDVKDIRRKKVTARQVLSHTAGLPNWRDSAVLHFKHDPGKRFNYSGEGYVWLSRVVEKITNKPIDAFVQQTVFQPLGMSRSSFVWQQRFNENFAYPHNDVGRTYKPNYPATANVAYSLQTTAADYSKFVVALLGQKGLRSNTFKQMFAPQPNSQVDSLSKNLYWGLGLGLMHPAQKTAIWQWGDNGTYKGFVIGYPETGAGLVYFANSNNGLAILKDVMQLFFQHEPPALKWINYAQYDEARFQLLRRCLSLPYGDAIKPYMLNGTNHQDTFLLPEAAMNGIGMRLLQLKKFETAQQLYAMNLNAYPASATAYEGLGLASMRLGQKEAAANAFTKCWELTPERTDLKSTADRLSGAAQKTTDTILVKTSFYLPEYVDARSVNLVGTFNEWNPVTIPMTWTNGAWTADIYLSPGTYSYKFVVDEVWLSDPKNPNVKTDNNLDSIIEVKKER